MWWSPVTAEPDAAATDLLRQDPHDRYFDYCLEPYRPRTSPRGKLRSENILWHALEHAGAMDLRPALLAIQASLGRDMTVWGLKHDAGKLWIELYFYDPQKQDPKATIAGLSETLAPWLKLKPAVPEWAPYMMASFDLFPDTVERGSVDAISLYMTGTEEHAGRSYNLTADGDVQLENTYRFMPPKSEVDLMLSLLRASVFVDYSVDPTVLSAVVIPRLFACKRVCVAKKRRADGIYYSGIDVDQLAWFLARFDYPGPIIDFVADHREDFDHLFFDVGIDYRQTADGGIAYPKSSFYGTL